MDTKNLLTSIGAPVAAAAIGSVATATGTQSRWYQRLDKPSFQPPPEVFPIAWSALYTSIAAASLDAQNEMTVPQQAGYRRRLLLNSALNAGWCWSFFRGRRLGPSVAVAGALAVSSADLARNARRASKRAGLGLVPYALWTGFATVLTAAIWRRNR